MFTEHCYVTGMGLDLGHMEVDEKIVLVVIKLAASRRDRHKTAICVIYYKVSTVVRLLRCSGVEGGGLWESGQQRIPEEVTFGSRTC